MENLLPLYDVIVVASGRPQPRKSFNSVDAAAQAVAASHSAGHIVKVRTNAITGDVDQQRQQGLAERVNKILAYRDFKGQPWQP